MQPWFLLVIFCHVFQGYYCQYMDITFRKCQHPIAFDCYHYCHSFCNDQNIKECNYRCQEGCGCKVASIVRNNGGCRRLGVCRKFEDSAMVDPEVDENGTGTKNETGKTTLLPTTTDPSTEDQAGEVTDETKTSLVPTSTTEKEDN
ncbi:uncharacterized protein LOC6496295 [Drosophila ananassae]|nr:uncharacterized protein LOC6496295 [Drosophila ananassae]